MDNKFYQKIRLRTWRSRGHDLASGNTATRTAA